MNDTTTDDAVRKISVRRDIASIVIVAVIAAVVCVKFNFNETLLRWTRPFERVQLDELPAVLLVVAISLIWFSSRRYFEANRQLHLRRTVEEKLAVALAENQRLAQAYIDMQEYEHKALARDLHDELGQYLNAIKLDAVSIGESMHDSPAAASVARAMIANIDRVYGVVTGLIRQLRPVGFDDLGVAAAVEHCINEWRSRLPGTTMETTISGDLAGLDETRGLVLYRLLQEALTNRARHSQATRVQIRIEQVEDARCGPRVDVVIDDNGCGMDMKLPRTGLGLVGMRERVLALGGSIDVASQPGAGFRVAFSLPGTSFSATDDGRGG
jgi:two-component system sensor histidine kinase UhpB